MQIQIPLKKVSTQTIFLFPKFQWEHCQKCKNLPKNWVSSTYLDFLQFFIFLTKFLLEFLKKKNSLCRYFFKRNLNLQSELKKNQFEKLTSHRELLTRKVRTGSLVRIFWIFRCASHLYKRLCRSGPVFFSWGGSSRPWNKKTSDSEVLTSFSGCQNDF